LNEIRRLQYGDDNDAGVMRSQVPTPMNDVLYGEEKIQNDYKSINHRRSCKLSVEKKAKQVPIKHKHIKWFVYLL